MTTKLTAQEAWESLPDGLNTSPLYDSLTGRDKDRFSLWYAYIKERIAAETAAELERLKQIEAAHGVRSDKTEMRKEISRLESELDKAAEEIAQLKARIAELERAATTSPPKPRKTAGEKLCDVLFSHGANGTSWKFRHEENKRALQAAAIELGLTDDPEPKSDGELFEQAWLHSRIDNGRCVTHDWDESAAEFFRLLAERDGVQHENA